MASKNSKSAPAATQEPATPATPTAAELYKANVARQAETHASLTQRTAPFCTRAGVGSRAWALDMAICDLHAAGETINVQAMIGAAFARLKAVGSAVVPTPGSHFMALKQRGYLAAGNGTGAYVLTEHGVKQAQACGALPADKPAPKSKAKGKK